MRSITDDYGLGTHTFYSQPDKVHMYCTIQSMNCVLKVNRQLLVEIGRLGSCGISHPWHKPPPPYIRLRVTPGMVNTLITQRTHR